MDPINVKLTDFIPLDVVQEAHMVVCLTKEEIPQLLHILHEGSCESKLRAELRAEVTRIMKEDGIEG